MLLQSVYFCSSTALFDHQTILNLQTFSCSAQLRCLNLAFVDWVVPFIITVLTSFHFSISMHSSLLFSSNQFLCDPVIWSILCSVVALNDSHCSDTGAVVFTFNSLSRLGWNSSMIWTDLNSCTSNLSVSCFLLLFNLVSFNPIFDHIIIWPKTRSVLQLASRIALVSQI